jgi:hypothetical protein
VFEQETGLYTRTTEGKVKYCELRGSRQPVLQTAQKMKLCVSLLTWRFDVVLGAKTQALPLPEIHLFKVLIK